MIENSLMAPQFNKVDKEKVIGFTIDYSLLLIHLLHIEYRALVERGVTQKLSSAFTLCTYPHFLLDSLS